MQSNRQTIGQYIRHKIYCAVAAVMRPHLQNLHERINGYAAVINTERERIRDLEIQKRHEGNELIEVSKELRTVRNQVIEANLLAKAVMDGLNAWQAEIMQQTEARAHLDLLEAFQADNAGRVLELVLGISPDRQDKAQIDADKFANAVYSKEQAAEKKATIPNLPTIPGVSQRELLVSTDPAAWAFAFRSWAGSSEAYTPHTDESDEITVFFASAMRAAADAATNRQSVDMTVKVDASQATKDIGRVIDNMIKKGSPIGDSRTACAPAPRDSQPPSAPDGICQAGIKHTEIEVGAEQISRAAIDSLTITPFDQADISPRQVGNAGYGETALNVGMDHLRGLFDRVEPINVGRDPQPSAFISVGMPTLGQPNHIGWKSVIVLEMDHRTGFIRIGRTEFKGKSTSCHYQQPAMFPVSAKHDAQ